MASDPFHNVSSDSDREGEYLSPGSAFYIIQDELEDVIRAANLGDAESSFRLHNYYRFYERSQEHADRWLLIAASQGHVVSQYNLAVILYQKNQVDDAAHWALLARNKGYGKAEQLIDKIAAEKKLLP